MSVEGGAAESAEQNSRARLAGVGRDADKGVRRNPVPAWMQAPLTKPSLQGHSSDHIAPTIHGSRRLRTTISDEGGAHSTSRQRRRIFAPGTTCAPGGGCCSATRPDP
jgi:hypothetical protein